MLSLALSTWPRSSPAAPPPPPFQPSLDFSDARNADYIVILGF
jgi:hypothetical protein